MIILHFKRLPLGLLLQKVEVVVGVVTIYYKPTAGLVYSVQRILRSLSAAYRSTRSFFLSPEGGFGMSDVCPPPLLQVGISGLSFDSTLLSSLLFSSLTCVIFFFLFSFFFFLLFFFCLLAHSLGPFSQKILQYFSL